MLARGKRVIVSTFKKFKNELCASQESDRTENGKHHLAILVSCKKLVSTTLLEIRITVRLL